MTSRLKQRLDRAGIDVAGSRANESFCLIGTPLPPLEKSKDTGEFVPLWKQDVRDEQGRRRLHGAFTGGFSAGYYNTVGSEAGWTPSTFKSSRTDRAAKKTAKPEDYMDEEDLAELRETRQYISNNDQAADAQAWQNQDVPDPIASVLLPPLTSSVGAKLLKKMGWRPGQGIGPRISYQQRRLQDELAGVPPPPEDPEAEKHTYAPRDMKIPNISAKDNAFGIGYVPAAGLSTRSQDKASGSIISAGFGLGALNDADDDDVDFYDNGLPQESRRMAFEAGDEDHETIPMGNRGPVPPKTSAAERSLFNNGAPIVPGFVLGSIVPTEDKGFEPPLLPANWSPDPTRVWESKWDLQAKNQDAVAAPVGSSASWKSKMTADQRGSLLGETPLPAAPKAVWDYISAKDRERLQNMKKTAEKPPPPTPSIVEVPRTDPAVAKAALMGFQPFQQDPVKQARYTVYLHLQAATNQTLPPQLQPLSNQTIEEFNVELQSFAKAAQIFKPMSMAMASRFKSSTLNEALDVVQEGLYQPPAGAYQEEGKETETETEEKVVVEESPKDHAARMGMFGNLTREEKPWLPAKLLCKRFGVKVPEVVMDDPANQMDIDERPMTTSLPGVGEGLPIPNQDQNVSVGGLEPVRAIAASDSEGLANMNKGRRDLNNIGLGEDDEQGRDILTYERPTMDIFKAIFASDEEDSGASDDEDKPDRLTVAKEEAPQSSKFASAFAPKLPPASAGGALQSKEQDTTLDLSSFRPTFVSKNQREGAKDKSSKPDKAKKKATKALVSFGVDEDDGGGLTVIPSMKKRKREKEKEKGEKGEKSKKKKKEKAEDITMNIDVEVEVGVDDDDMWVEKPVNLPVAGSKTNAGSVQTQTLNTSRRPKAVDFL